MRSAPAESVSVQKLRGGYYTSAPVADWLCAWAIRSSHDTVLEPSCGSGAFLLSAAKQLLQLDAPKAQIARQMSGVEIVASEAAAATAALRAMLGAGARRIVATQDFFQWCGESDSLFDAVVGNPPFIRYQSFPEPHRSRAMSLMAAMGLSPNRLTNIWVPFVTSAIARLRAGGRMALVLPAELLQVGYAAQLRAFLTDRFERIDIVACNELFFENAEQEVVLLLAQGALAQASADHACRVTLTEAQAVSQITSRKPGSVLKQAEPKTVRHDNEKWLKYFLMPREIELMRALREADAVTTLKSHAGVDVGVVTGKNEFFVLTEEQVGALELARYMAPLISRSAHLKGACIGKAEWKRLSAAGDRVHLLHVGEPREISGALKRYIRQGEEKAFHKGFKCSIRKPWYKIPSPWVPDGFLFRQIYDFPRIVLNDSGATSTDTIHRFTAKAGNPERIVANTYTWLTAASAEIEGRSYGGGVLELEPTEAERLLVPAKLNGALPMSECDRLTRAGRLNHVLEENARIVLKGHMGLSHGDCIALKNIWTKMRDRRLSRRRQAEA